MIEGGRSHENFVEPVDLTVVGVGPLFAPRGDWPAVAWMPRFVEGTSGTMRAVGMRNGIVLDALAMNFEVAHDFLRVTTPAGPYNQHGVRAVLTIDVIQLTWWLIQAAAE